MNVSLAVSSEVQSVSFSVLTTEDVRRISVKQITNPVLLDDLNRPNVGGLYDPALGPVYKQDMCVLIWNAFMNSRLIHRQMFNMPPDVLQLPWSLWTH
jgi:hypothetical protein